MLSMEMTTSETQNEPPDGELDFYPTHAWGLDHYFMIFNKMYIADVLQLRENAMYPGTYMYRSHPLFKVDIVGVVVKVDQNHTCFTYTVDDGTGVIPCCCWKKDFYNVPDPGSSFLELPSDLQRLAARITDQKEHEGYNLGDLIRVRGKIKVFRDQREVVARYHTRLDDPMEEVQRLAELPKLYKQNYDQPVQLPQKVQHEIENKQQESITGILSKESIILQMKKDLMDYFQENQTREITLQDDILEKINLKFSCSDCEKKQCVEDVLVQLEEEGKVCTRQEQHHNVIEVLVNSSALEKALLDIMEKKCRNSKYSTSGCHLLNLHQELCRTFQYAKVKVTAVRACLTRLEENSDIIRVAVDRYITVA